MDKTAKILIVDDGEDKVEILSRQLKQEGYKILKAYNAKDAIEIVRKQKLDLILMDVNMPEMDGFEATRIIKKENKTIFLPIIIVTATRDDTEAIVKGLESGADEYISLPCEKEEMQARVRAMLRTKQLYDKLSQRTRELREKTQNLERFHKIVVGRELEMVKLKGEINSLLEKLGQPKKYKVQKTIKGGKNK